MSYFHRLNNQTIFSIITVVYNAECSIATTLNSILNQTCDDYEVVIIDGASTDGTMDVVSAFNFPKSITISENDNGIYDAMNKGIKCSTGEYIYFLNAGDYFASNTVLDELSKFIKHHNQPSIIYGEVIGFKQHYKKRMKLPMPVEENSFLRRAVCHQAVFARRELFDLYGLFDLNYPIVADYLWLSSIYIKHKVRDFVYVNLVICFYSLEGISSTSTYNIERFKAALNNFSLPYLIYKGYIPLFYKRAKKQLKSMLKKY